MLLSVSPASWSSCSCAALPDVPWRPRAQAMRQHGAECSTPGHCVASTCAQTPPAQSPVTTGQSLNSSSWPRGLPQPSPSPSLQPHPLQLPLRCPCCYHTCLLILLWAHLSFQDPVLSAQALCPLCPETLCSAQFDKEVGQVLTGVFRCQGDKAA